MDNIVFANEGDKIKTRSGEIFEFVRLKRTKFIGKKDSSLYDIPVSSFVEIIEKAEPKKIDQGYKSLKQGELFYIDHKGAILFFFEKIENGRIIAKDPIHGGRTRIDVGLYGGKVSDLKAK